ncbi:unnamed protein product [Lasius platythorax]|uniref:Uncharacterized protein n=1 Tax=Lasius platythorax TaxID=488582 RepID=A0AAV2NFB4_9HYME
MPIGENGMTPVEILYGRRIRNLIPSSSRKKKGLNEFAKELKKRQVQQKQYYDKGSKLLEKLKVDEAVKVHRDDKQLPHHSGKIVGFSDNPRSYRIKTEQGNIIERNRKALTKGKHFVEQNNDLDDIINEKQTIIDVKDTVEGNNESKQRCEQTSICTPTIKEPVISSKSGRVIKKPSYLKDYVCLINKEISKCM